MNLFAPWDDFLAGIAKDERLAPWLKTLPGQLEKFQESGEGKIFRNLIRRLKRFNGKKAAGITLTDRVVSFQAPEEVSPGECAGIKKLLQEFMPWRKGPYNIFGVPVASEWESWMKWERLLPHITPLQNRLVLDVGAGNGYHMWRMLGENAAQVTGIDPSGLFLAQFAVFKSLVTDEALKSRIHLLPLIMEDLPPLNAFDTVFSMGVLDHRPSPAEHLMQLWNALRPGGELVLETLVTEGDSRTVLLPAGRYAKMSNVWFIPAPDFLKIMLRRAGFPDATMVSLEKTTPAEQHRTELMTFESLEDYLDPQDPSKTVEGYPAPMRAIFIAKKGIKNED